MKRFVVLLHRTLGAALCGLFAVWFASGLVMIFAPFPHLGEARRLAALPPLELGDGGGGAWPSPAARLVGTAAGGRIRLGMLGGRPVYRFVDGDRGAGVVGAAGDGDVDVTATDAATLAGLVESYVAHADADADGRKRGTGFWGTATVDRRDQWNITSPASSQFPLRRFDAADGARSEIYVSLKTAEVVQATTRRQRWLAWLGAIPHWLYPIALRRHAATWRWLVIAVAGLGALGSLSGLALGVWSWRPVRRRRLSPSRARGGSPYRERWMRWHHTLGLGFGLFAFTWVGSGALSLNPFRSSDPVPPAGSAARALAGGELRLDRFLLGPAAALAACRRELEPRELELVQVAGRPYYLCRQSVEETRLVDAARPAAAPPLSALAPELVLDAGRALWPEPSRREATLLPAGDTFLESGDRTGGAAQPARILRVRPRTGTGTWTYVDLRTGKIVLELDAAARVDRWLYRGLHTFDFPFLPAPRSRAWYIAIVGLCALGVIFSATGIAVALGWLQRARRRTRPKI